jgi:molybdopterin synthase sulfur carrier subunit
LKKEEGSISVNVNFLGPSQDDVGKGKMVIGLDYNSTLKDLLKKLANKIGPKFKDFVFDPSSNILNENVAIIVNGRHITALDGLETPMSSGDEVSIFPPLGGG